MKNNHSFISGLLEYTKSYTKKIFLHPFLKAASYKKTLKFLDLNRDHELYKKIFKPETKPMIENVQEKLKQGGRKQSKGPKICVSIRWDLECKQCSKTYEKWFLFPLKNSFHSWDIQYFVCFLVFFRLFSIKRLSKKEKIELTFSWSLLTYLIFKSLTSIGCFGLFTKIRKG